MISRFRTMVLGALSLVFVALNLTFWLFPVTFLALIKLVIPLPSLRRRLGIWMKGIYDLACAADTFLFCRVLGITFEVSGLDSLSPAKSYLVLANHQSWADIFVVQTVLSRHAPLLKFIAKRGILTIPLVGLICWAYDYPIVRRTSLSRKPRSGRSTERDIRKIEEKLSEVVQSPACIINFLEGTRYSAAKSRVFDSPYTHLLPPRCGGLFFILSTWGEHLASILDFTIVYRTNGCVLWSLLGGKCRQVVVRVQSMPLKDVLEMLTPRGVDPNYQDVVGWARLLWSQKDRAIGELRSEVQPSSPAAS